MVTIMFFKGTSTISATSISIQTFKGTKVVQQLEVVPLLYRGLVFLDYFICNKGIKIEPNKNRINHKLAYAKIILWHSKFSWSCIVLSVVRQRIQHHHYLYHQILERSSSRQIKLTRTLKSSRKRWLKIPLSLCQILTRCLIFIVML